MVLSTAMDESHVEYYSAFPLLQGERPDTLDWTEDKWCAPIVSWHHMSSSDISSMWDRELSFTQENGWSTPYQFRNAFSEIILPLLTDRKEEWDNLAHDTKIARPTVGDPDHKENKEWDEHSEDIRNAAESWEGCKHVCEMAEDCVQWKFSTEGRGICHLNKAIRLGNEAKNKEGQPKWESGWMVDRIRGLTEGWKCKEVKWKFNQ